MTIRFTKMQGIGNDYVYIDCFNNPVPANPAELAIRMSDRHFGVGSDGLILILPSEKADARMQMFNADGSESEMCGNGIRCVAKYVFDHGIVRRKRLAIETGRGVLTLDLELNEDRVSRVTVDMGEPIFEPARVPTTLPGNPNYPGDPAAEVPLEVGGEMLMATCLSMGNPHCVVFVDEPSDHWVLRYGPKLERDSHFPRRVNVSFVQVISPGEIKLRVWERGSGETLACGTGACASCVAAALTGRTSRKVVAHLRGGDLDLHWDDDNHVYMTGPAVEVFKGEWPD